ncbi:hypothetical protein [Paenibacillus sp. Leaf72]|uniref:hypothetical protein n=1 Tax=Paenibacillus sp. Leaf72 TaxID=1736234 RepID=UPI0006FF1764|nr:hypothetical protein [Paenibacillus sp. Leaf72]KQO01096.1 hypothetical protein ASF12_14680 [Paenibacillus sp. Leaf72]
MNHFIITQDERVTNALEPLGVRNAIKQEWLTLAGSYELDNQHLHFRIKDQSQAIEVDFIERPVPLVSDRMKSIIEKFAPRMYFKPVGLIDLKQKKQLVYWLIIPPKVACLSKETVYDMHGNVQRLVINRQLIGRYPMISIEGIRENIWVINLALAESLLRRDLVGVRLTKAALMND